MTIAIGKDLRRVKGRILELSKSLNNEFCQLVF